MLKACETAYFARRLGYLRLSTRTLRRSSHRLGSIPGPTEEFQAARSDRLPRERRRFIPHRRISAATPKPCPGRAMASRISGPRQTARKERAGRVPDWICILRRLGCSLNLPSPPRLERCTRATAISGHAFSRWFRKSNIDGACLSQPKKALHESAAGNLRNECFIVMTQMGYATADDVRSKSTSQVSHVS